jgi:hypothetical protein
MHESRQGGGHASGARDPVGYETRSLAGSPCLQPAANNWLQAVAPTVELCALVSAQTRTGRGARPSRHYCSAPERERESAASRRVTLSLRNELGIFATGAPQSGALPESFRCRRVVRDAARCRFSRERLCSTSLLPLGDSGSDGGGAYRLLGSLTTASQLTSEMLAKSCRISKRLSRTTYRPAVRSASLAARLGVSRSYTLRSGAITARTADARTARGANTNALRISSPGHAGPPSGELGSRES